MALDNPLKKDGFGTRDMLDRLSRDRVGEKADEIAGVARLERDADFAVGFEPADPRPVARAGIDDNERSQPLVNFHAGGRNNSDQHVVDRMVERATVDNKLGLIVQNVRRRFCHVRAISVAALAHDIHEQDAALRRVHDVARERAEHIESNRISVACRLCLLLGQ